MFNRSLTIALALAFATPAAVGAQQAPAAEARQSSPVSSAPAAGPRLDVSAVAMRNAAQPADSAAVAVQRRGSTGKPVALMIVGGAAIVLGSVIGEEVGTLFMIGGAVALLYGLYHYLQ